ncbi:MAG: DUF2279 domain-containing protein [Gemmatimonadaceae bacterium]
MILSLLAAVTLGAPGDRWFAPDKLKHFFVSAFVQSVVYSAARATRAAIRTALYLASAATLTVGVGKEIRDRHTASDFSAKDLTWDVLGGAAASLVLTRTR